MTGNLVLIPFLLVKEKASRMVLVFEWENKQQTMESLHFVWCCVFFMQRNMKNNKKLL